LAPSERDDVLAVWTSPFAVMLSRYWMMIFALRLRAAIS